MAVVSYCVPVSASDQAGELATYRTAFHAIGVNLSQNSGDAMYGGDVTEAI